MVPLRFFSHFTTNWSFKKGPSFYNFKNFAILSLRYSADFGRSPLVIECGLLLIQSLAIWILRIELYIEAEKGIFTFECSSQVDCFRAEK